MKTKLFEATQPFEGNWGKFIVGTLEEERYWPSEMAPDDPRPLLRQMGYGPDHLWVLDWQTGEGGFFRHGGHASADLNKKRIQVCPMFEPFLKWLYAQDIETIHDLPQKVVIDAPFEMYGYRRSGLQPDLDGNLISSIQVMRIANLTSNAVFTMIREEKEIGLCVVDYVDGRPIFWRPSVEEWALKNNPDGCTYKPSWFRTLKLMTDGKERTILQISEKFDLKPPSVSSELSVFQRMGIYSVRELGQTVVFAKRAYTITQYGLNIWNAHGENLTRAIIREENAKRRQELK